MADAMEVAISFGEVLDKITILEIKSARIKDQHKLENVHQELNELGEAWEDEIPDSPEVAELRGQLRSINEQLWDIEDSIRDHEKSQDFGPAFIELARSVYLTNDRRAAIKKEVNVLLGSRLIEEKSYSAY
ncbi:MULTISPECIES: DUF6165 family protein [unclassified Halomonas]|uniref:DUF6165 family protein n=1 Tax=unclassified Halomonas TaxID=2609666 RepID=UPI0007D909DB|nr:MULTISPECIES: DUF6165 family protein [unclassified Halomonas]MBT2786423.1 hypothetical protein [Halomonas sp. ISL-106]MBT2797445.1 hypothetical protein [Halomonas sp. ISL-104]OAL58808.1 hypothetical protein A6R74_07945 [Halomonas sp. ALS9]